MWSYTGISPKNFTAECCFGPEIHEICYESFFSNLIPSALTMSLDHVKYKLLEQEKGEFYTQAPYQFKPDHMT